MSEKIDLEKVPKYKNTVSQNSEFQRETQKRIDQASSKSSKEKFTKLCHELTEKNTYFAKSKIPEVNEVDLYTKSLKSSGKFRYTKQEQDDYCQKCPSLKNHCPHKNQKEQIKDKYSYPILSNSVYGWFPPVDNLQEKHNVKSVTKDFYDHSHL